MTSKERVLRSKLPQYVNTNAAAEIKGVTPSTIYNWIEAGLIAPVALLSTPHGNGNYLFDRKQVEALVRPIQGRNSSPKPKPATEAPLNGALVTRLRRIETLLDRILPTILELSPSEPEAPAPPAEVS